MSEANFTSSPCPPYRLIPQLAVEKLAYRFQTGIERKGKGAWNALSDNQDCLEDKDKLMERLDHGIKHIKTLQEKLASNNWEAINEDDDAAAIMWLGAFAICAIEKQKGRHIGTYE